MKVDVTQEFVDMFDLGITVTNTNQLNLKDNEFYTFDFIGDFINIPKNIKEWKKDILTGIMSYHLIDYGFHFYKYCSYKVFTLLHEIGHIINGKIENELVYTARIDKLPKDLVNAHKEYILIPDEWYAWEWAWDFVLKNKEFVKKLDSRLSS